MHELTSEKRMHFSSNAWKSLQQLNTTFYNGVRSGASRSYQLLWGVYDGPIMLLQWIFFFSSPFFWSFVNTKVSFHLFFVYNLILIFFRVTYYFFIFCKLILFFNFIPHHLISFNFYIKFDLYFFNCYFFLSFSWLNFILNFIPFFLLSFS